MSIEDRVVDRLYEERESVTSLLYSDVMALAKSKRELQERILEGVTIMHGLLSRIDRLENDKEDTRIVIRTLVSEIKNSEEKPRKRPR